MITAELLSCPINIYWPVILKGTYDEHYLCLYVCVDKKCNAKKFVAFCDVPLDFLFSASKFALVRACLLLFCG